MAYSANITVVPPAGTTFTFLAVCPTGTPAATCQATAALTGYEGNATGAGNIVSNSVVIPANAAGSFDVWVYSSTAIVIDINGYYVSPTALALGSGTVSAPSLTFSNDATTGLYSSGAGTVKVTASGTDRLTVNSAGLAVNGNVDLTGNITKGGQNLLLAMGNNTGVGVTALNLNGGSYNLASGYGALRSNTGGSYNTASGYFALENNTTGNYNTASGAGALFTGSTASHNTATGYDALYYNTSGYENTASGSGALMNNTTGYYNTGTGRSALYSNTTGSYNTATGYRALFGNTTATQNTATGYQALTTNSSGNNNTADGYWALYSNTSGALNTAIGMNTLANNTIGGENTAVGLGALAYNTTGSNNLAVGWAAGSNVSGSGNNNIHIGTGGSYYDSGVIRVGGDLSLGDYATQTQFFAAGIYGANVGGNYVYVNSHGQLSSMSSSRRFKQDIHEMGDTTELVMGLRPVRFHYKSQGRDAAEQYGLIAEEVSDVAPDLVGHDKDGQIDSVYYDKVNAILLNEVQKQHRLINTQKEELKSQQVQIAEQHDELTSQGNQLRLQALQIRDLQRQFAHIKAASSAVPEK
jgi:hypothetical protein